MIGGGLTAEQKIRVWEAFDRYTFHTVRKVDSPHTRQSGPMPRKVYAVVQNHWEYNDSYYDESEALLRVFLTRAEAAAECQKLDFDTRPSEDGSDDRYTFEVIALDHNPAED